MALTEAEIINATLAYISRNRLAQYVFVEGDMFLRSPKPILSVLLAYEEEMRKLHEAALPKCNCNGTMAGSHDPTCPVFQHTPSPIMHYRTPHTFTAPCGINPVPGLHWTTERTAVTCPACRASFE